MLARIAESLYWIGRNIERSEHCSRYIKVQYFSTMDAHMVQNKDFTLRSILYMWGGEVEQIDPLTEREVWRKVIFDPYNTNSILSVVRNARENARGIRNSISSELWESINKLYLSVTNTDFAHFSSADLHKFAEQCQSDLCVVKYNITNTLLHGDNWHFINLGIYIERVLQLLRIIRSKISDWMILSNNGENKALIILQWTILLKTLECFDLHNQHHRGQRTKTTVFKMILSNPLFPRSIRYSADKLMKHLNSISVRPEQFELTVNKLQSQLQSSVYSFDAFEDEEAIVAYIDDTYQIFADTHFSIEQLYFQ